MIWNLLKRSRTYARSWSRRKREKNVYSEAVEVETGGEKILRVRGKRGEDYKPISDE